MINYIIDVHQARAGAGAGDQMSFGAQARAGATGDKIDVAPRTGDRKIACCQARAGALSGDKKKKFLQARAGVTGDQMPLSGQTRVGVHAGDPPKTDTKTRAGARAGDTSSYSSRRTV